MDGTLENIHTHQEIEGGGVECIQIKETQASGAGAPTAGAGGLCESKGESAFTTMLMLGLNSASYCTHSAATAAS